MSHLENFSQPNLLLLGRALLTPWLLFVTVPLGGGTVFVTLYMWLFPFSWNGFGKQGYNIGVES